MITVDMDALRELVRETVRELLGGVSDRRATPRSKNGGKSKRTCPVQGCKNVYAPRFGGYCKDHRGTAGFKRWESGRKKAKA